MHRADLSLLGGNVTLRGELLLLVKHSSMADAMEQARETIWQFIRGDMEASAWEEWLYAHAEAEELFGRQLYLSLISADYRLKWYVEVTREDLETFARAKWLLKCECVTLPETAVVDMVRPGKVIESLEYVRKRGSPYWWLSLSRCTVCGTSWLFASEERQNDLYILRRLSSSDAQGIVETNQWPPYFDSYATLLRLGNEAGHSASFVDPLGDSSLAWTMADLASEKPGIGLAELAALLNLDMDTAAAVADQAMRTHGVHITHEN